MTAHGQENQDNENSLSPQDRRTVPALVVNYLPSDSIDLRPTRIIFDGKKLACFDYGQEESMLFKLEFKDYYKENTIDLLDVMRSQNEHIDTLQSVVKLQAQNLDLVFDGYKDFKDYGEDALEYSFKLNRRMKRQQRATVIGLPLAIAIGYIARDQIDSILTNLFN